MPLVVVSVNAPVPDASKKALAKDVGHIISNDLKVRKQGHMVAGKQQARVVIAYCLDLVIARCGSMHSCQLPCSLIPAALAGVSLIPLFCFLLQIPQQHVHIQVQDGQFISFAGDPDAPAVTVRGNPLRPWTEAPAIPQQHLAKWLVAKDTPLLSCCHLCITRMSVTPTC